MKIYRGTLTKLSRHEKPFHTTPERISTGWQKYIAYFKEPVVGEVFQFDTGGHITEVQKIMTIGERSEITTLNSVYALERDGFLELP